VSKPRLLDLFCGAGGAAMGYSRAGFKVVGVDIKPQPRYPFKFIQADALLFLREMMSPRQWQDSGKECWDFAAIHASPPCQAYSSASIPGKPYPDLYEETRILLEHTGLPWVLENVRGAPHRSGVVLCGSQFGMRIRRHRYFETSFPMLISPCNHEDQGQTLSVTGNGYGGKHKGHNGMKPRDVGEAREVMGIDWMTIKELSQAVPPAYTELVGTQLLPHIRPGADPDEKARVR